MEILIIFIYTFFSVWIGIQVGKHLEGKERKDVEKEAVKRGYAKYILINGGLETEFKWVDEIKCPDGKHPWNAEGQCQVCGTWQTEVK